MSFRIGGLDPAPFRHLYGLPDEELARLNVRHHVIDEKPRFPDRVEMRDADLVEGSEIAPVITRYLADSRISYLHAHYARRGCYAGRIERA